MPMLTVSSDSCTHSVHVTVRFVQTAMLVSELHTLKYLRSYTNK